MRRPHSPLLAVLLVAALAGCTAAPAPQTSPQPAPPPAEPAAAAAAPMSAGLHWSRNSAEARALFLQSYRQAAEALEALVAGRDPFTWAISIDGDETLLDNSPYQLEREAAGLGFTEESWNEWVRRREAPALPGARDFLETVRRLGGKIAVVTNRGEVVCGATEDNLRNLRLPYDLVLCKPTGAESDKSPRWQAVEEGRASKYLPPLDLVLWVGDNVHDFPGGSQEWARGPEDHLDRFGRDFVILPNVMYGSWERNPQE
jgi:5'-nucleotidase (lipoprotein e(P4) family)